MPIDAFKLNALIGPIYSNGNNIPFIVIAGIILGYAVETAAVRSRSMDGSDFDTGVGKHGTATKYMLFRDGSLFAVVVTFYDQGAASILSGFPAAYQIWGYRDYLTSVPATYYHIIFTVLYIALALVFGFVVGRCFPLYRSWRKLESRGTAFNLEVEYRLNFIHKTGEIAYDNMTREGRTEAARKWLMERRKGIWLLRLKVYSVIAIMIGTPQILMYLQFKTFAFFDISYLLLGIFAVCWLAKPATKLVGLKLDDWAYDIESEYVPFARVSDTPRKREDKKSVQEKRATAFTDFYDPTKK